MVSFISSWRCSTLSGRVIEFACDWMGVGLPSLSRVPGMGEGEQLEWAMTSAVPACDDSCGEGRQLLQVNWNYLS